MEKVLIARRCGQRRDKETRPGVCEWAADGDGAWCEVEIRVYFRASEDCRAQVMTNRGQEGSQTQAATMVENGGGVARVGGKDSRDSKRTGRRRRETLEMED